MSGFNNNYKLVHRIHDNAPKSVVHFGDNRSDFKGNLISRMYYSENKRRKKKIEKKEQITKGCPGFKNRLDRYLSTNFIQP